MNNEDNPMQVWCPRCRDFQPTRRTFEEMLCTICGLLLGTRRLVPPKMPAELIAPRQKVEA